MIVLPYNLMAGQIARAAQVMANFNALVSAISSLAFGSYQAKVIAWGGTYDALVSDNLIVIREGSASATLVVLPAQASYPNLASSGQANMVIVKEGSGLITPSTPITISAADGALIDGLISQTITGPYGALSMIPDGAKWNIVA